DPRPHPRSLHDALPISIIRQGLAVRGLTTAATLWVVAAIGMASGTGYYSAAVITTGVALLALWPLRTLAYRSVRRFRGDTGLLRSEEHTSELQSRVELV